MDGEIIRLFDPVSHEEVPLEAAAGLYDDRQINKRWVRIRRPTIIVAGELTMEALEVAFNPATGISEAPLQMKSNCGTLVIDDFGRQRMRIDELLNRWIVPLEKHYDFLNLPNGKKVRVPFDQLLVFSTNLEPRDLVNDAFLRRIPYKIEVHDPSVEEFRSLFEIMAGKLGFEYCREAVERSYREAFQGPVPPSALLLSPRHSAPGPQLLRLPQAAKRTDPRTVRHCLRELLCCDVRRVRVGRGQRSESAQRPPPAVSVGHFPFLLFHFPFFIVHSSFSSIVPPLTLSHSAHRRLC